MTSVMPMEDLETKTRNNVDIASEQATRTGINLNWYATKKTIAQGMLDIALLTANSAQLKHILLSDGQHRFYYPMLWSICISITLQIIVGIGQLALVSVNINYVHRHRVADILNNVITSCVFIITVINVIISAFGIEGDTGSPNVPSPPVTPVLQ